MAWLVLQLCPALHSHADDLTGVVCEDTLFVAKCLCTLPDTYDQANTI